MHGPGLDSMMVRYTFNEKHGYPSLSSGSVRDRSHDHSCNHHSQQLTITHHLHHFVAQETQEK